MEPKRKEALRLLELFSNCCTVGVLDTQFNAKQAALVCCEEIAKRLPNINETPPIYRNDDINYFQFWKFGVKRELQKINPSKIREEIKKLNTKPYKFKIE